MKSRNWNDYIYEHIFVAEKILGRKLRDNEEVHHLDHNKQNNRHGNLLILEKSQHTKLHNWISNGMLIYKQNKYINIYCKSCTKLLKEYCSASCVNKEKNTHLRKVKNRPTKEELESMIENMSWVSIGRKYGVSDNSIRKWAKQYKII